MRSKNYHSTTTTPLQIISAKEFTRTGHQNTSNVQVTFHFKMSYLVEARRTKRTTRRTTTCACVVVLVVLLSAAWANCQTLGISFRPYSGDVMVLVCDSRCFKQICTLESGKCDPRIVEATPTECEAGDVR